MLAAEWYSTVTTPIITVLLWSTPPQILNRIVFWISISMKNMHPVAWWWPQKRFCHHSVNALHSRFAIHAQVAVQMSGYLFTWSQYIWRIRSTFLWMATNIAAIRHLIPFLVTDNWLPDFYFSRFNG